MWRVTDPSPYGPTSATLDAESSSDSTSEPGSAGSRRRAPLATAALVVALVIPALNLVFSAVAASALASSGSQLAQLVYLVEGIIVFVLAVAAAVMGTIVLVRRSAGRARAAAAFGVAAVSLWNIIVGLINGALLQAFLG